MRAELELQRCTLYQHANSCTKNQRTAVQEPQMPFAPDTFEVSDFTPGHTFIPVGRSLVGQLTRPRSLTQALQQDPAPRQAPGQTHTYVQPQGSLCMHAGE